MRHESISKNIRFVLFCSLLLTACNKYLDVTPKGYKLLTTVADYDLWLNDNSLWTSYGTISTLDYLGDNYDMATIAVPPSSEAELLYTWAAQPAVSASLWGTHYNRISSYNSVIKGIDAATGGTEQQKRSLKAEALICRAYEYLYLINEYGKPYDSTTAAKDLGIQLIVSDDVAQELPPRSTVKDAYDFIIADLNKAIPDLPDDNNKNRYRASVAGGYSLLARVYLNMRNYNKARENAQMALDNSPNQSMLNYNTVGGVINIPNLSIRQDAIFARGDLGIGTPTREHLQLFNKQDTRLRFFYNPLGDLTFTQRGVVSFITIFSYLNVGTTIQEMKLIIAEVAARNNDLTEALKQLDDVRRNRIPAASYVPYQSGDKEFVLRKVLEERQFEFAFIGMRWFDMRRLDAEGRMPPVNRYDAQGNVIATLQPHSARYTLMIPEAVIQYNSGIEQNP